MNLSKHAFVTKIKGKVIKAFHTRYRAMGPKLIPVYRQSDRR